MSGLTLAVASTLIGGGASGTNGQKIPTFSASLLSSLIPEVGPSEYTFARNSAATVLDFEGNSVNCIANEARFAQCRRVENLLRNGNAKSNDINDGVWAKWLGTETINGANQYTETVGSTNSGINTPSIYSENARERTFVISFSAFKVSGTSTAYRVRLLNQAFALLVESGTLALSGSLQRFSVALTVPAGAATTAMYAHFRAAVNEPGRVIHIEKIQIEDVTPQANQNPSEYVSYGMGDDHGCGVDGVKWFPTENGNTVASDIVTEATGAAIALTPMGYREEQQKTNRSWPYNDLTHANWTKSGTVVSNLSANGATTIAGSVLVNTVRALNTSDVEHIVSFPYTTLSGHSDLACSFWIKKGTLDHVYIRLEKGAETATQFFDVSTGTVGSVLNSGGTLSVISGHSVVHEVNGGYWIHMIFDSAETAGAHTIKFGVSNADSAVTFAAANTTDILAYFGGMQIQLDHEVGCLIPALTGETTKLADQLSYPLSVIPGDEFAMVCDIWQELPSISNSSIMDYTDDADIDQPGYSLEIRSVSVFRVSVFSDTGVGKYLATSPILTPQIRNRLGGTFSRDSGKRAASINGSALTVTEDNDDTSGWVANKFYVGYGGPGACPDAILTNAKIYPAVSQEALNVLTA